MYKKRDVVLLIKPFFFFFDDLIAVRAVDLKVPNVFHLFAPENHVESSNRRIFHVEYPISP